MSVKHLEVAGIGKVSFYKRRGVKSFRLSIAHDGAIKLTMPSWTPLKSGLVFVNKNKAWITDHRVDDSGILSSGKQIGKAHVLRFMEATYNDKISTRLVGDEIRILMPIDTNIDNPEVQAAGRKGSIRALKKEADQLLPTRVEYLSKKFDFTYNSLKIRHLKSRWGSCTNNKDISLSIFLMQLPWDLIDYVILHELTHTKVLAHGKKFWDEMDRILPESKKYKKSVNKYKPSIR